MNLPEDALEREAIIREAIRIAEQLHIARQKSPAARVRIQGIEDEPNGVPSPPSSPPETGSSRLDRRTNTTKDELEEQLRSTRTSQHSHFLEPQPLRHSISHKVGYLDTGLALSTGDDSDKDTAQSTAIKLDNLHLQNEESQNSQSNTSRPFPLRERSPDPNEIESTAIPLGRTDSSNLNVPKQIQCILGLDGSNQTSSRDLSDASFDEVSRCLLEMGHDDWSLRPRIYAVLSMIGAVQLMDVFVTEESWDIALPFSSSTLPRKMTAAQRNEFVKNQSCVLTTAANIEGGKSSAHANFEKDADAHLEPLKELGKGGFGSVDVIRSKLSRKNYVRKRIKRSEVFAEDRKALKNFRNEIANLKKLNHRHLIRYVGSYTDPKYVGILMEPIADCDLQAYLNRSSFSPQDYACIREAFGCLCAAVLYLQKIRCRHRDIKPHNILVKGTTVYITDFGIARDWSEKSHSTTGGNPGAYSESYAAPEVAAHEPRNTSSDIWSLGCVFLEMTTILKGETLDSKQSFFKKRGSGDLNPRTNKEAYKDWLRYLRLSSSHDNTPLEWVASMIRVPQKARITAEQLLLQIRDCDDEKQYCKACCDGYRDDNPAEYQISDIDESSDSEDYPLSDSMRRQPMDSTTIEERLNKASKAGDVTAVRRWLRKLAQVRTSTDQDLSKPFRTMAIHNAIRIGNEDIVEQLVHSGCDLNQKFSGQSPLLLATSCSHENIIEILVNNNVDLNSTDDKTGDTCLHRAASNGLHSSIKLFLGHNMTVDATNRLQQTPLFLAILRGDFQGAKILIDHGASMSIKGPRGFMPLHSAVQYGSTSIIRLLLDRGADIEVQSAPGYHTPLMAAVGYNQPTVAGLLLEYGANINQQQNVGDRATALHLAALLGHIKVVEVLLTGRPLLEIRNAYNSTPFHDAFRNRHWSIMFLLLNAGADIDSKIDQFETVLTRAVDSNNFELAQDLISHGANIETKLGRFQGTLLHRASTESNLEVLQFLLKNKANTEARDKSGLTPLMVATKASQVNNIRTLLETGANVNSKSQKQQCTALHLASHANLDDAVSLLIEHGADVNMVDREGCTPLMRTAQTSSVRTMAILLKHGAAIGLKRDGVGATALHMAASVSCAEAVSLLLEHGAASNARDRKGKMPIDVAPDDEVRRILSNTIQRPTSGLQASSNDLVRARVAMLEQRSVSSSPISSKAEDMPKPALSPTITPTFEKNTQPDTIPAIEVLPEQATIVATEESSQQSNTPTVEQSIQQTSSPDIERHTRQSTSQSIEYPWINSSAPMTFPNTSKPDESHQDCIYSIALTKSYLITASRDRSVRVWSLATQSLVYAPLTWHTASVLCIAVDESSGVLFSGGAEGSIIAWRLSNGKVIRIVEKAHEEKILSISISKRYLVTGCMDKSIKVWSVISFTVPDPPDPAGIFKKPFMTPMPWRTVMMHSAAVNSIIVTDTHVISASGDRQIRIWDLQTMECIRCIVGHTKGIACIALSPDGSRIISGSSDNTVRIFNFETGLEEACLAGHTNLVRCVSYPTLNSVYGSEVIISGSYDESVMIWAPVAGDTKNWEIKKTFSPKDSIRRAIPEGASARVFKALYAGGRIFCATQASTVVALELK